MEERKKFINSIISIYDNDNNIITYDKIEIYFSSNKYSSKKNSIWHLDLVKDNSHQHLNKRLKYKITYECNFCKNKNIIGVTQLLRKLNKLSIRCHNCSVVLNNSSSKKSLKLSNKEKIEESLKQFNELDDDFKDNYFSYHLTNEEFDRMKKNIISFQNGKIMMNDNITFIPIIKCNNQMCFTSMMYDIKNDILFKANQPILKCQSCNIEWRAKSLEKHKNKYIIKCKDCSFVSNTFKIRNHTNINKESINYQSKLELKFINFCNNNAILIRNGPKINYTFNNKSRRYIVDFEILINNKKYMVEIKDNHIWHKEQINNGMWECKKNAAIELVNNNIYHGFYIIYPKNWMEITKKIKIIK